MVPAPVILKTRRTPLVGVFLLGEVIDDYCDLSCK